MIHLYLSKRHQGKRSNAGGGWFVFYACLLKQYNLMGELLHIRVCGVELLHGNGIQQSYYSITYKERQYFTSTFTHTTPLPPDDIIIPLEDARPPDILVLHRWENCMVVFEFQIDSSQLRNRRMVRKRVETRQLELLSLELQLYTGKEIFLSDRFYEGISQHYLIVEELANIKEAGGVRAHQSLNYFTIQTKGSRFFLPVRSAVVSVKLPAAIEISSFVNSHFNGKSALIDHSKLVDGQQLDITKDGKSTARVKLKLKWGVNLHRFRSEENVLVEATELLLYDFQLKFDSPNEMAGCKLKIQHGSKAFEFAQDIDHSKVTKIKKIVYFIVKSDSEEVDLLLHKNGKPFAACRVSSAELTPHALTLLKKKWTDVNNPAKVYGYIKLRGERARNVSIPQWNRYWRDAAKRKQTATNMLISVQQVSLYFPNNQPLILVAKIQNQEKPLKSVLNLNFYDDQDGPSPETLDFAVKGQESLILIAKNDLKSSDFCGIGVVNTTELRLGMNACEVGFFKNQEKAGTINCIIQKVVFWPFLKPLFQQDVAQQQLPPLPLDLFLNKITLTPYFYTYKYDNKRELYCIVEVNKAKKVLILENVQHDPLSFAAAAGSDSLNYTVEQPQTIRIKLTFLVSDLGHEEEIYGVVVCKTRVQDLDQKQIKFKNVQIRNDYSVALGTVTLQAFRGVTPKVLPKLPLQPQKKSLASFDLSSQASFDTNNALTKQSPSRRYSGSSINNSKPILHDFAKKNTHPIKQTKQVKLPIIKEKKAKDQFQDLVQLMKVRKRGHGGFYEDNRGEEREVRKHGQSFDLKRIEQSNPNLDRNLEILFPKKANQKQILSSRSKQVDYEQRLRGLRSVMNQIEDIGQVQPSLGGDSRRERYQQAANETEQRGVVYPQQAQWQGNEFV